VANALTARLAEQAGFECCFVTGAGLANTQFGLPDVGLLSMTEVDYEAARIIDAVSVPVIVDADAGYGGPLSVMRTVHALERSGAAAVQIEDQASPKRCGHFDGQTLVDVEEMVAKIRAAVHARSDPEFAIIARTDARAVEGLDQALARGSRYVEAGADVIFVEAPQTVDELRRIPSELPGVPMMVNIVEGGKTPQLPAAELEALGYRLVLHANLLLRVTVHAARDALSYLRDNGESTGLTDRMITWDERQSLVNLKDFDDLEDDLRGGTHE
jgi:2,3-dimethylmalate lyase